MKAGAWYLAGARGRSVRIYRVAAMQDLELTGAAARRPRDFDLAHFWSEASAAFETGLRSKRARVRLSPLGRQLARDWNPSIADAVDGQPHKATAGGWIEVDVPMEPLPHAAREVLRLGAEIEVLEPATLRAAVAAEAGELHASTAPTAHPRVVGTAQGRHDWRRMGDGATNARS